MREQRIDERALPVAGGRMDHHPGRLVDDDQMLVLEADVERDRLCRRGRVVRLGQHDDNPAPRAGALCRVAQQLAVAGDLAGEDQLLEAGARQLRQLPLQGAVEAHAAILGRDGDFDAPAGRRHFLRSRGASFETRFCGALLRMRNIRPCH